MSVILPVFLAASVKMGLSNNIQKRNSDASLMSPSSSQRGIPEFSAQFSVCESIVCELCCCSIKFGGESMGVARNG